MSVTFSQKLSLLPPALLILTLLPMTAQAQESFERISKRGQINVGYREDAAPFSLLDHAKRPAGYSIDFCKPLLQKIAKAVGDVNLRVRYLAVPVDEVTRMVKSGMVDLMCSGTSDTPKRRLDMGFSKPIYIASTRMLVSAKNTAKSVAELGGKTVVVIDQTTAEAAVKNYANQQKILWQVAKAMNPAAALGQLKLGWAGGYVRDDVLLAAQLASEPDQKNYKMLPDALSSEVIAIAFSANDKALSVLADEVVDTFIKSGDAKRSYDRWLLQPIAPGTKPLNLPMSAEMKALLGVK